MIVYSTALQIFMATKIFLDSGDPSETRQIVSLLGSIDGQTTNPTLISKHPVVKKHFERGEKFTPKEIMDFYKKVVTEISVLLPHGSVSVEVYADTQTTHEEMIAQGRAMFTWIPNAQIKLPTTHEGLLAAEALVEDGVRINMTLCFSEEQAVAVYGATMGAKRGQVFISPFIGRLDDQGQNGMDLVKNIISLYQKGDGHVEVLAASMRSLAHINAAVVFGADIFTASASLLTEWADKRKQPPADFSYQPNLATIPHKHLNLNTDWRTLDITHPLTEKGLERFSQDWNILIKT